LSPGDIVVMDNLTCHKVAGIQEAIKSRDARLLYLPPYSPDLNSIEQAFVKLKALLRKVGERSRDGLWMAIGQGSSWVSGCWIWCQATSAPTKALRRAFPLLRVLWTN
jgi:transposase